MERLIRIRRTTIFRWLVGLILATGATMSAHAASPLPLARVIETLAASGHVPVAVELLSPVVSKSNSSRLSVTRVDRLTSNTTVVRMRCEQTSDCIPFLVWVRWASSTQASEASAALRGTEQKHNIAVNDSPIDVRSGESALLVLQNDRGMVITLPVRCLQSGRVGDKIRVATRDYKVIRVAEIVQHGLVKGGL